jgi:hypothetical protein
MTRTLFSGRNNDRAPARQMTVSFFSGRNDDCAPAREPNTDTTQQHNWKKVPPAHAKRVYSFLRPSVRKG